MLLFLHVYWLLFIGILQIKISGPTFSSMAIFVVIQWLSCVWLLVTPWAAAWETSLSFAISKSLLKLMSTESVMPSNHLILCHPLLFLPSIFPSIRVFSNESTLRIRWPEYWSFSFSIRPSNEYSGLVSFRTELTSLISLLSKGLWSILQHHISKGSIIWHSAFFMVQFSLLYMITGKTIALTKQLWPLFAKWCLCFWICYLGFS